jgi:hypothetical protein
MGGILCLCVGGEFGGEQGGGGLHENEKEERKWIKQIVNQMIYDLIMENEAKKTTWIFC